MRGFSLLLWLVVSTAAAQEPLPGIAETTRAESAPPPPPTREQLRYMEGLRSAGRGVAQLKDAVNRVSSSKRDAQRLKQAARRLGGLCGTARGFMAAGRAKMQPTAYQDSTRIKARRLSLQVDSLIRSTPNCESSAARQPDSTAASLLTRIKAYDTALKDFRAALAVPHR